MNGKIKMDAMARLKDAERKMASLEVRLQKLEEHAEEDNELSTTPFRTFLKCWRQAKHQAKEQAKQRAHRTTDGNDATPEHLKFF